MEKFLWEMFKKSGDIKIFMAYKEYEEFLSNNLKNKKMNKLKE